MRPLIVFSFLFICINSNAQTVPQHQLRIVLHPELHKIAAEDQVRLPSGSPRTINFSLHRDLHPVSPDAIIDAVGGNTEEILQRYRITLPANTDSFTLIYGGEIFHPPQQDAREARTFENSPGIIAAEGAVLSGASGWYPILEETQGAGMMAFSLDIAMPQDWRAVSQGKRILKTGQQEGPGSQVSWEESQPQDEIFLIAAPFTVYQRSDKGIEELVYLRNDDAALAQRYLDATARYLEMYRRLIGDYPYAKFALVENFWETGYGMPSFTLLGSQVIRLPFIVDTSYPHEILHNWWGNGVYVDYQSGNWSEGLTAYLADHLVQEQNGNGAEYRRGTLQKYADFVTAGRDFPLAGFTSRHSAQSEAVGYGKAMMMFHMLRRNMGDDSFLRALQNLYREFKFRRASYADLEKIFSRVSGPSFGRFFAQWVQQAGAPQLRLVSADAHRTEKGYELTISIEQTQPGPAYFLELPLAITLAGKEQAYSTVMKMADKRAELRLPLGGQPLRVDVDPEFDVFRRLDGSEIPPALSQVFGAEQLLIVLPRKAGVGLREQYLAVAKRWQQQPGRSARIVWDDEIKKIPPSGAVWLFGWENRWRGEFQAALGGATLSDQGANFGSTEYSRSRHSLALTAHIGQTPAAWLAVPEAEMMATLARKLPHYSKYSYAVFEGAELNNLAKGIWPLTSSLLAMPVRQADGSFPDVPRGKLAPRSSLVR
ncbi:MAG: M1 family metallopeptidase [Pseudomonadota bacterium]